MKRRGYSLIEVLIAAAVLAVFMLPVLLTWLSAKGSATQDLHEVAAANMACEILEQVAAVRRYNGALSDLPGGSSTDELDLETIREKDSPGWQATLYPVRRSAKTSRIYLSVLPKGYKRFLRIEPAKVGGDNGFFGPQVLWKVRARVVYATAHAGRMLEKEFSMTSYIFDEKRSKSE